MILCGHSGGSDDTNYVHVSDSPARVVFLPRLCACLGGQRSRSLRRPPDTVEDRPCGRRLDRVGSGRLVVVCECGLSKRSHALTPRGPPNKRLKLLDASRDGAGSLEGRLSPLLTPEPERSGALPHGSIILTDVWKVMGMGPGMSITAMSQINPSVPQKHPIATLPWAASLGP